MALVTCVLFGLAPALRATHIAPGAAMKTGGRGVTADRERFGLRRFLVVAQMAFSLVLVAGALLFMGTLRNLMTVDPGFRPDDLIVLGLDMRRAGFPEERRMEVRRDILERLRHLPGVVAAGQADIVPMSGTRPDQPLPLIGTMSACPAAATTPGSRRSLQDVPPDFHSLPSGSPRGQSTPGAVGAVRRNLENGH